MTIYDRIKARREQLHMSQQELANKLGYKSRSAINKIESGLRDINQSKIVDFAEALETTPAFLTGWEEPESQDRTSVALDSYPSNVFKIQKHKIPLLGTIAAGKPIFAEEDLECFMETGANIEADFCLRVQGDSMVNARINDGDIVFIRQQCYVDNGEIAAVLIDDEATLKRVYRQDHGVMLVAENPKYAPMVYHEDDFHEVRILGKAVAFQSVLI